MAESKTSSFIIGLNFIIIGIIILVVGYFSFAATKDFIDNAGLAEGSIVQSDRNLNYNAAIIFQTEDGMQGEKLSKYVDLLYSLDKEEISIYYDKTNPKKSKVDSFFSLWGLALLLTILGIISIIIGIFYFIARKKRNC